MFSVDGPVITLGFNVRPTDGHELYKMDRVFLFMIPWFRDFTALKLKLPLNYLKGLILGWL